MEYNLPSFFSMRKYVEKKPVRCSSGSTINIVPIYGRVKMSLADLSLDWVPDQVMRPLEKGSHPVIGRLAVRTPLHASLCCCVTLPTLPRMWVNGLVGSIWHMLKEGGSWVLPLGCISGWEMGLEPSLTLRKVKRWHSITCHTPTTLTTPRSQLLNVCLLVYSNLGEGKKKSHKKICPIPVGGIDTRNNNPSLSGIIFVCTNCTTLWIRLAVPWHLALNLEWKIWEKPPLLGLVWSLLSKCVSVKNAMSVFSFNR